jgi:hypothetical protein
MAKKTSAQKLKSIIVRLTRKFSPDVVQLELSKVYEEYSIASQTEQEIEFWFKCARASKNLSGGMNKWAHDMIEDLEEDEVEGD